MDPGRVVCQCMAAAKVVDVVKILSGSKAEVSASDAACHGRAGASIDSNRGLL